MDTREIVRIVAVNTARIESICPCGYDRSPNLLTYTYVIFHLLLYRTDTACTMKNEGTAAACVVGGQV